MDRDMMMYMYTTLLKTMPSDDVRYIHMECVEYLYEELRRAGLWNEVDEVTDLYLLGYFTPVRRVNEEEYL